VEDSRPNSGHLQVAHPSPITGLFESHVELTQEVRAGDTIGRVVDPMGKDDCKVFAQQSGMIICLAAYARVIKGSGLAVVMETKANNVTFWRP
jgi:predicted deacylase